MAIGSNNDESLPLPKTTHTPSALGKVAKRQDSKAQRHHSLKVVAYTQ